MLKRVSHFVGVVVAAFQAGGSAVRAAVVDPLSADQYADRAYRRQGQKRRDLPPIDVRMMQDDAAKVVQRDGLGRQTVRILRNYTVGANSIACDVQPASEDEVDVAFAEELQEKVDRFWNDRRNRLPSRVREYADSLATFGEVAILLPSGEVSKKTRVGFIDPGTIDDVVPDPEDVQRFIAIVRTRHLASGRTLVHPVIDECGEVDDLFAGKKSGEGLTIENGELGSRIRGEFVVGDPVAFEAINRLANQTRGTSDLYPGLDLLGLIDRSIWRFAAKMANVAALAYHAAFPASSKDEKIKETTNVIRASLDDGEGGIVATKGEVKLNVLAHNLSGQDWGAALRTVVVPYATAVGIPDHLLTGEGGEDALASITELAGPFVTMLQDRQEVIRRLLGRLVLYAVLQYPELRREFDRDDSRFRFSFNLPTIVSKDSMREVTVLEKRLGAIGTLRNSFGLSLPAAQREARQAANEYGMDLMPEDFDEELPTLNLFQRPPGIDDDSFPGDDGAEGKEEKTEITEQGQETGERPEAPVGAV